MKHTKKVVTGLLALSLAAGFTGCKTDDSSGTGADNTTASTTEATTTTKATVEKNTETLSNEENETLQGIMSQLPDVELANKEIKWLAHYTKNVDTNGQSKALSLEMFEQKYGGYITDYHCEYQERWDSLSNHIVSGDGIDFFPGDDVANYPNGVVNGMFQPVNDYIDLNSALWQHTKAGMELFNYGGNYFSFVTNINAEAICIYDKSTIEANNFDDPWELYEKGEWNWDTFKGMLQEFVDEDNEMYGLDDWFFEKALWTSAGCVGVKVEDGHIVSNLDDPVLEKTMQFGEELRKNLWVRDFNAMGWSIHPELMGAGQELFQLCGAWEISAAPETWANKIDPENLGVVPVPSPKGSDPYCGATLAGYALCKGAANPEGVARFAECEVLAAQDPDAIAISDRKAADDYKWSQDIIDRVKVCNDLARQYPVYDFASGVNADVGAYLTNDGGTGLRAVFHTDTDWATVKGESKGAVEAIIQSVDADLQARMKELNG